MQSRGKKIIFVAVLIIGTLFLGYNYFFNNSIQRVSAAPSDCNIAGGGKPLKGWAWASEEDGGIGWVSFNSEDCDTDNNGYVDSGICNGDNTTTPMPNYKVSLGASGDLSGCAWSSSIGWIRFNPQTASAPGAPNQSAQIDTSTGLASGWARACNVFQSDCSGSLKSDTEIGGWDGWLKMAKDSSDGGGTYGVVLNGNKLEGFAWGGDVIGWLNFWDVTIDGLINCSSFSASPSSVKPSQAANLNWQCQLAQNCNITWKTVDGTQNGSLGNVCNTEADCNNGDDENIITQPITKETTFTLNCSGYSFLTSRQTTVGISFTPTRCEINPRTGVLVCP